ncbi:MAG: DAK2 domain-containing protein, partial [Bacilli bacterium]|nr:DAK2 domain-containing protein [Bacilli bacterium]
MEILTAKDFAEMLQNGYRDLKSHYDEINDLNVFPVPDGDTGTNIASTLTGGVKAVEGMEFDNLGELSSKLARGMLLGARGNSGVIVSQFFAGIAKAFQGLKEANLTQFAAALQSGTNKAYEAVVNPVEGTILTVARRGSEHINRHIDHYNDFESLFTSLLRVMREALDKT